MKIYTNVKRHQDKTKGESECQLMILIYIQAVFGLKILKTTLNWT